MWFISALAPIVIVGGIVVFVMKRMERQYKEETLGKKKIKRSSKLIRHFHTYRNACRLCNWFDFRHVFPDFSLLSISLGSGIGYLFGFCL